MCRIFSSYQSNIIKSAKTKNGYDKMKNAGNVSIRELTKFYSKSRQRLLNFLRKNVNEPDAQDILHDAFIKAWQNLCKFQGKAKIATWFSAILRNLVYDHYKRKYRFVQLQTEPADPRSYRQIEQHSQNELKSLLQKAIESLPNRKYRQIIKLRYYDHLKLTQIHKILNLSYKAAEMQHRRALKALKELILKEPSLGGLLEYVKTKGFKKC